MAALSKNTYIPDIHLIKHTLLYLLETHWVADDHKLLILTLVSAGIRGTITTLAFLWCRGQNSGSLAHQASTLPTNLTPQPCSFHYFLWGRDSFMDPTWPPIHEDNLDPQSLRPSWDYRYATPCPVFMGVVDTKPRIFFIS